MKQFVFEAWQFVLYGMRLLVSVLAGGNSCVVCGRNTALLPVCGECNSRFFSVPVGLEWEHRCSVCGKELLSLQGKCMKCRSESVLVHTDRVFPLFSYRLWNKTLLFTWKIQGERALSPFFAEKAFVLLRDLGVSVVVPVPPRKGKIRKKGWDQINELARFLKWRYGFNIHEILERCSVQEQKKLTREQRLEHIKNAYRLSNSFRGEIPEEVCLLDDVCTTGSTLESCSAVLKAAGVKKVYAVTLFTVD